MVRMTDNRLPKTVFCSDLEEGARFHGGQQKRYKDTLKANLKRCDIEPSELEELEHRIGPNGDRTARARSSSLKQIVSSHWKPSGYSGRHGHISVLPVSSVICGRSCASRIGLYAHRRTHPPT